MTYAYNVPAVDETAASRTRSSGPLPYGHAQPRLRRADRLARGRVRAPARARARCAPRTAARSWSTSATSAAPARMRRAPSRASPSSRARRTAGVEVVDRVIQLRDRIDPKFVLGNGKLEDVVLRADRARRRDADLRPRPDARAGARHREAHRSQGASIARSSSSTSSRSAPRASDGKLQVELAQLKYTLPRLGQKDDSLSRLTGGIGGRGPGETKLEIGRRRARERVHRLERELNELGRQRARAAPAPRDAASRPSVAIVGYTNAGKSTLLNTLTGAGVLAEDKLFATLDTRARQLRLLERPRGRHHRHRRLHPRSAEGSVRRLPRDLRGGRRRRPAAPGRRRLRSRIRRSPRDDHRAAAGRARALGEAAAARLQQGRSPGPRAARSARRAQRRRDDFRARARFRNASPHADSSTPYEPSRRPTGASSTSTTASPSNALAENPHEPHNPFHRPTDARGMRPSRATRRALALLATLTASACTGPLGPPLEAFHDGRLPEAAAHFRRLEPRLSGLSASERARYALYRGLSHLGLGDARAAHHWLTIAKRVERDDPSCFDAVERGELYAAWRSMGRTPGED